MIYGNNINSPVTNFFVNKGVTFIYNSTMVNGENKPVCPKNIFEFRNSVINSFVAESLTQGPTFYDCDIRGTVHIANTNNFFPYIYNRPFYPRFNNCVLNHLPVDLANAVNGFYMFYAVFSAYGLNTYELPSSGLCVPGWELANPYNADSINNYTNQLNDLSGVVYPLYAQCWDMVFNKDIICPNGDYYPFVFNRTADSPISNTLNNYYWPNARTNVFYANFIFRTNINIHTKYCPFSLCSIGPAFFDYIRGTLAIPRLGYNLTTHVNYNVLQWYKNPSVLNIRRFYSVIQPYITEVVGPWYNDTWLTPTYLWHKYIFSTGETQHYYRFGIAGLNNTYTDTYPTVEVALSQEFINYWASPISFVNNQSRLRVVNSVEEIRSINNLSSYGCPMLVKCMNNALAFVTYTNGNYTNGVPDPRANEQLLLSDMVTARII